jgi:hypothetical protein
LLSRPPFLPCRADAIAKCVTSTNDTGAFIFRKVAAPTIGFAAASAGYLRTRTTVPRNVFLASRCSLKHMWGK